VNPPDDNQLRISQQEAADRLSIRELICNLILLTPA
jgi:hypothetical protein